MKTTAIALFAAALALGVTCVAALAQPLPSAFPSYGAPQPAYQPYQAYPTYTPPPLIGTTFPLGGGLSSTQFNNVGGGNVICTTFPLGGGLTTTQCN